MKCHEVDYRIIGDDMQMVEIELDPDETVVAEAGAMMYMEDPDRNRIIGNLGNRKGERIREELRYQARLALTYQQYRTAVSRILDILREERGSGPVRSYIRPRGRGGSRTDHR